MSIVPQKEMGEFVLENMLLQWTPEEEEIKLAQNIDDLKEKLKLNELSVTEEKGILGNNYKVFKKDEKHGLHTNVAYECPHCQHIIIGPPIIKYKNDIKLLSGQESIDTYCRNCDEQLREDILAIS
jgi:NAD-dependent SIR2 family protein deacetylase